MMGPSREDVYSHRYLESQATGRAPPTSDAMKSRACAATILIISDGTLPKSLKSLNFFRSNGLLSLPIDDGHGEMSCQEKVVELCCFCGFRVLCRRWFAMFPDKRPV